MFETIKNTVRKYALYIIGGLVALVYGYVKILQFKIKSKTDEIKQNEAVIESMEVNLDTANFENELMLDTVSIIEKNDTVFDIDNNVIELDNDTAKLANKTFKI